MKYNGAVFNVGPILDDNYSGVHTYSTVLFPLLDRMKDSNIDMTWLGHTIQNSKQNKYVEKLKNDNLISSTPVCSPRIDFPKKSLDLLDYSEFDFLLLQPRPKENVFENYMFDFLIDKFTKADKKIFLWEQDMFEFDKKLLNNKNIVHLRPYTRESDFGWRNSREFLFGWDDKADYGLKYDKNDINRIWDFMYLGNVYGREPAAQKFFSGVKLKNNAVFGNWIDSEKKRVFSSQFSHLKFKGSTDHNLTIPLLNASLSTLQILPEAAAKRGLETARVFTSEAAKTLCFGDIYIADSERFFPAELLVKNGIELTKLIEYLKQDPKEYLELLNKRSKLMKKHTVTERVREFKHILKEEL